MVGVGPGAGVAASLLATLAMVAAAISGAGIAFGVRVSLAAFVLPARAFLRPCALGPGNLKPSLVQHLCASRRAAAYSSYQELLARFVVTRHAIWVCVALDASRGQSRDTGISWHRNPAMRKAAISSEPTTALAWRTSHRPRSCSLAFLPACLERHPFRSCPLPPSSCASTSRPSYRQPPARLRAVACWSRRLEMSSLQCCELGFPCPPVGNNARW